MLKRAITIFNKNKMVILYLIFGGLTTLINIVIYAIFTKLLKVEFMISNVIAWIVAVLFAYLTNKTYVFENKTHRKRDFITKLISFFIARFLTLLVDIAIMYIGVKIMYINDLIMKIFANIIVIIINYYLSKYIIFRKKRRNLNE